MTLDDANFACAYYEYEEYKDKTIHIINESYHGYDRHMVVEIYGDKNQLVSTITFNLYSDSLDRQIPIWKKLTVTKVIITPRIGEEGEDDYVEVEAFACRGNTAIDFNKSIPEASCVATAQAILGTPRILHYPPKGDKNAL